MAFGLEVGAVRLLPVSERARAMFVDECWAVVHSFKVGQFFVEQLPRAVEKNFESFVTVAGEDWQIVGIFPSLEEAHDAITVWIRTPGAKRARKEKMP
jgi:hypothetical protein